MANIVEQYLSGLKSRLSEGDRDALSYASGASTHQIERLKAKYPSAPTALLELLNCINGTYWQKYDDQEVSVQILGSDIFECPYYLKSVEQILEADHFKTSIRDLYGEYFSDDPEFLGPGVNPDVSMSKWLGFADCFNNGGTSQLFIDFNPGPGGKKGQVVRFLHDPDSFVVISDSFEHYLQKLMDTGYSFIMAED